MPRSTTNRVVRAVADTMWERDKLQMRVIENVLAAVAPAKKRTRRARPQAEAVDDMRSPQRSKPWAGFRAILCPIDFSDHSRDALRYADAIAVRAGAALRVCYVNDPLLVAAAASRLRYPGLALQSKRELRLFVETTLSSRPSSRHARTLGVLTGDPGDEILKEAARRRSDLIVLGTHGLTGVDRLFLGSTTLSVLQRTQVPVLAVPRSREADDFSPSASWPGDRILAAVELDGASPMDVNAAARLAGWFGASLLLVHVIATTPAPNWLSRDLSARQRILVARVGRQLRELAAGAPEVARADGRVVCGRIADEIAAIAATERIELLITALRDRRGWFGARRGSVSYSLLSHAVAPVLAYPPEWARGLPRTKRRTAF